MENCSVYGLVSFISTRYHHIDFNQAMRCLLQSDGDPAIDKERYSRHRFLAQPDRITGGDGAGA
jgi:hypothetical protein